MKSLYNFHTFCEDIQFRLHPAATSALEKFVMLKGLSTAAIQAKLLLTIVALSVLAHGLLQHNINAPSLLRPASPNLKFFHAKSLLRAV